MTDLRNQLAGLFDAEPAAPHDIDQIVRSGRRARRRHNAALAVAGTVGAAGVTAAVVIPVVAAGGHDASFSVGVQPSPSSPSATATPGRCYIFYGKGSASGTAELDRLIRSGKVGAEPSVTTIKRGRHGGRSLQEVCSKGMSPTGPGQDGSASEEPSAPAGPPYRYSEKPESISSRLGAHLADRVEAFGLSITYTRPFSQETSDLEHGHPSYFSGNVDVHEANGYADIGVQVIHEVTELVPFTGDCTAAEECTETTLSDGSVLQTGRVKAGRDNFLLTAELHRPDGVVVQAQESNYPFGPDAGTQPHGDQPLTLDQLVTLAKDDAFTF